MATQPEDFDKYFQANKEAWNKRTAVHKDSSFYDAAAFRRGKTTLQPLELLEVGNVKGKSLLHLQCHFGLDTLSWAREGATVTGVDLSDDAINFANQLKEEMAIDGTFICCNVYDLPAHLIEKFDVIFTSYGVVGWLPDLDKWASIVSRFLKPGGTFYIAEFHPVVWMFDANFKYVKYYYHNRETISEIQTGTYTDRNAPIEYEEFSWNHSLSEVINSLIKHGLEIRFLNEHSYSSYNCFTNLVKGDNGNYRVKGMEDKIPMMYSIKAIKQR